MRDECAMHAIARLIVGRAESQSPGSCFAYPASATLATSAAVVEILLKGTELTFHTPAGKPPGVIVESP